MLRNLILNYITIHLLSRQYIRKIHVVCLYVFCFMVESICLQDFFQYCLIEKKVCRTIEARPDLQ